MSVLEKVLSSVMRIADESLRHVKCNEDYSIIVPVTDEQDSCEQGSCIRTLDNNDNQKRAIDAAMKNRLTLIQGPPG